MEHSQLDIPALFDKHATISVYLFVCIEKYFAIYVCMPLEAIPGRIVMDVLSIESGLRNLNGNETLYNKLLRRFSDSNQQIVADLNTAISAGDNETAVRIAHTLKSTAASLGLLQLSATAAEAEHTLMQTKALAPEFVATLSGHVAAGLAAIEQRLA